jgi:hypothetical protein
MCRRKISSVRSKAPILQPERSCRITLKLENQLGDLLCDHFKKIADLENAGFDAKGNEHLATSLEANVSAEAALRMRLAHVESVLPGELAEFSTRSAAIA